MKRNKIVLSENSLTAMAMAGISLPWIAYEALVPTPDDFWSFRGVIFLAVTCIGLIMLALAWYFDHQTSNHRDLLGRDGDN
jgi:hypothetical protein